MSENLRPEDRVTRVLEQTPDHIRNIMIIAHVDHGKTTLSDSLIAQAGLLNQALAGSQLLLDKGAQEKDRGITITTGCISLPFHRNGKDYLVNLRDTPGHVDFVYQVDKTTRAVQGAILLIDAKEGVKTQTETVLGLAVNEGLPIILVLNKIDRLIRELNSTPRQVYERILRVVQDVNSLLTKFTGVQEPYFTLQENVLMGSGLDRWMISVPILREKGIKFSTLVQRIMTRDRTLVQEFNVARTILSSVIARIPAPHELLRQKLSALSDQVLPEDLQTGDPSGSFRGFVCDSLHSKVAGSSKVIRVLSGTLRRGDIVHTSQDGYTQGYRVQKILVDMTRSRIQVEAAPAGAIVMITGVPAAIGTTLSINRGETVVMPVVKNTREPVVSMALSTDSASIPALLGALRDLCDHDSTMRIEERDGQIVLSGVGELQLQIAIYQVTHEYGLKVQVGKPSVTYSQTLAAGDPVQSCTVRTPNGLTDFRISVAQLPPGVRVLLQGSRIQRKSLTNALEACGYPSTLARKCEGILNQDCLYINDAKGALYMKDCRDDIVAALSYCLRKGPLMGKPLRGLEVRVTFANIHEDPKKRSELQFSRAFQKAFEDVFRKQGAVLLEPVMRLDLSLPVDPSRYLTSVIAHLDNNRGVLQDTQEGSIPGYLDVRYALPLSETFGLNKKLMSLCQGRVSMMLSLKDYFPVTGPALERVLKSK